MDIGKSIVALAIIIAIVVGGIFLINRYDSQSAGQNGVDTLPKLVAPAQPVVETPSPKPKVCEAGGNCLDTIVLVAECCHKEQCVQAGKGNACVNGRCVTYKAKLAKVEATVTVTKIICPNGSMVADASMCPAIKKEPWAECEHSIQPDGTEILVCQGGGT